ncbi:rod shape-determining protein MreD [Romboutsia sp. 13368]|uniref:rod shape-determining protein MreD n=1 Tax=Romboutsia sp. 13368 TaxID=2708053 RepID=UPI0025CD946B|nr:rod shape-determining protein MreD [Romboutsia sp. 13368]
MKKVLLCLLGILLVIVEMSITNYIDIFDVSFNLIIIYITIISLYLDKTEASIIGAIIGIVKDIAVGGIFGVNALILFTVGYGISLLKNEIYKESNITIFALVFITSLFNSVVNMVTVMAVYNTYGILKLLMRGILILPLINSTLSILLYNIFKASILKLKED